MLSGGDEGSLTTRRPLFPGLARSPAHPRSGCGSSRAFARSPALLHGQAAPSTPAPSLCRRFQGSALPVAGCSRNRDKESTKTWSTGEKLNTKAKQLNIANVFIITEGNAVAPRARSPGGGGRGGDEALVFLTSHCLSVTMWLRNFQIIVRVTGEGE